MKILSANEYKGSDGFHRKVLKVVINPDDPEFIHADNSNHPTSEGGPNGCPHTLDADGKEDNGVPGCTYNWQVHEHIWDGDEMHVVNGDGGKKLKTNSQLIAECKASIEVEAVTTTEISALVGKDL